MTQFVEVYSLKTFRKFVVPEHWIGDPVLGVDIRPVERRSLPAQAESSAAPDSSAARTAAADESVDSSTEESQENKE